MSLAEVRVRKKTKGIKGLREREGKGRQKTIVHEVTTGRMRPGGNEPRSERDVHIVVISKRPIAVRTLARTRGQAFFNTVFAEDMAASLDRCVLKVLATNCADRKCLYSVSENHKRILEAKLTRNISYSVEEFPRLLFLQLSRLFLVSESVAFKASISASALRCALEVLAIVESLETDSALSSETWAFRPSMTMLSSVTCC